MPVPERSLRPIFLHALVLLFRLAALEFGLPLEIGFLDVSRANYTNLRAACNQAKRTWRIEQQALMQWLGAIYRWKILNWIREGRLQIDGRRAQLGDARCVGPRRRPLLRRRE